MKLGDMQVIGDACPPAKLCKALAVIGAHMHPAFDRDPAIVRKISRRSCVLASLAVRDFLHGIGFPTARMRPVSFVAAAKDGDVKLHSLGIGFPILDKRHIPGHWCGHMVVDVAGWLIDTTLYEVASREAWRGHMPSMVAIQTTPEPEQLMWGMQSIAGAEINAGAYALEFAWLDNPGNVSWSLGPDAIYPSRRQRAVRTMRKRFGRKE